MDESTFPTNGREHDQTPRDTQGSQSPVATKTKPTAPDEGRFRRILPWLIAAVAALVAAIAIGVLIANQLSEPRPVAQLTAQTGSNEGVVPVDEETAQEYGVADADFVAYGSYGAAEIWSTTTTDGKPCLAVIVEERTWMFRCAAPTFDTIADIDIDPDMVPPAPSGEPAANVRFVLNDGAVDVYLAPNPDGGYY